MEDLICRICSLKSNCLLSIFAKYENSSPYQMLQGLKLFQITDNGSAYLCSQCLSELVNCVKFFEKCEKSNKVLSNELAHHPAKSSLTEFTCNKTSILLNDHLDEAPDDKFLDHNLEKEKGSPIDYIKPGPCTVCGSKRSCVHKSPSFYKCNICHKVFTKKFNYTIHIKRHLGLREWPCPACGAPQVTSWLANRHCLRGSRYVCPAPDCTRSYTSVHNLTVHFRNHTGERPHKCTECNKRFTSKTTLNDHIRIHTGVKPYMCSICGAQFRTNKLVAHLRTHAKSKQRDRPPLKTDITRTQKSGMYGCEHCSMRYSHKQSLNRHLRKRHAQPHKQGETNVI